ncbi:MAG TPA: mannose-1-phosphate guanylyltransferase/mannose-6-phosphate isomerase [Burkholderiales bacterium]|nr:mannose-1-phosphate guanylyltransferase/mannose-6-phosphate isomerase [Burkholderiales bacterium]
MNLYPVILSGGAGSRLWPLSRESLPKQFLKMLSERTLFQETILRLNGIESVQPPLVIANHEHRFLIAEQLRDIDVRPQALLLEPAGRNTAPAVAAAAYHLLQHDEDALMLVLPADHHLPDVAPFHAAVRRAVAAAERGFLVTFGVVPRWPESGYGYIQRGDALDALPDCYRIASFVEKPEPEIAAKYIAAGDYFWNSGMFLFGARQFRDELERLRPQLAAGCRRAVQGAVRDLDFLRLEPAAFAQCEATSVDYAIMEPTAAGAIVMADFRWSDLGSWESLWEAAPKDSAGNFAGGDVYLDDVRDSYVVSTQRMVAAIGIGHLVVVETPDAVLVCDRDQVQRVRQMVEHLKSQRRAEHAQHRTLYRPWGHFESIDAGPRFRVKRITVNPGRKLSLQLHHHRAEHWVVVTGTAKITRGDETIVLSENQSTYIPVGVPHRLENPGKIPLQIIEVQSGAYLEEDDIVRLEDAYNRA